MSVRLMNIVYEAHFYDIEFEHKGKKKTGEEFTKKIRVVASNLKSICLALADHANDEGEGAYPSIWKLESKTELSRVTVIACLKALKHQGLATYMGISKFDTCNYTINREILVEMASRERQKREKKASKATSPSKDALPEVVKPLSEDSKAAIPEPSFNRPLTSVVAPAPTHTGMINPNSGNRTDAKVKGDPMDGILDAARQTAGISEIEKRILAFPVDCQSTLRTLVEFFRWQGSSIPENKGRGGTFGQWISEIRTINSQVGDFGQSGVKAACKASVDLTVSHPAAITWAIGGELGKLSIQQEKTANVVDTPFAKALEDKTPRSPEFQKSLEDFGKVLRERTAAKKRQTA